MVRHVLVLSVTIVAAAGCGFSEFRTNDDAGNSGPATCDQTKLRGYEPLGTANNASKRGGIAPAGDHMAAVWEAPTGAMGAGAGAIYFALVDNLGKVSNSKQLASGQDPVLLRGDSLILFFRVGTTLMMQALDDGGGPLGAQVTIYDGIAESFNAVWTGSEFGIVMNGAAGDQYEANWLRVAPSGTVLAGPMRVTDGGNNSLQPALAWTGHEYWVVWTDTRPGTPGVYFARFDQNFSRQAPDVQISPSGMRAQSPSIAMQETGGAVACYMVSVNSFDIYCNRFDDGGNITASPMLTQTLAQSADPQVVTHGRTTWVLWDEINMTFGLATLNWQFLDESGAPINPQPFDDTVPGWLPHAAVTSDALYAVQYGPDPTSNALEGQVVTINCF